MPAGRPKVPTVELVETLPSDWRETAISMFSQGASKEEVKATLRVTRYCWDRMMKESEEFSSTIKEGEELSQAWWYENGRVNLQNKSFQYVGWYMNMKNRFGWKDRQDVTSADEKLEAVTIYKPSKDE